MALVYCVTVQTGLCHDKLEMSNTEHLSRRNLMFYMGKRPVVSKRSSWISFYVRVVPIKTCFNR